MAELARGDIADRPWGRTLGALGTRGLSGQLTLIADGKHYCVAFTKGAVVGASSPLASDSAVRMALTSNLVSSTQVAEITRRIAAAPTRDEVELLAELTRLAPDQAQKLRRRLIAQRAARTFSIDRGQFVVDDRITVPVLSGSELDIRAVIYLGARNNLSEDRLGAETAQLGAWFQIKPEAVADLPQFGFTGAEKPILQMLVGGADLAELEGAAAELGVRTVHAIIYALVSCGACETSPTQKNIATSRVATKPSTVPPAPRAGVITSAPTELRRGPIVVESVLPVESRTRTPSGPPLPRTLTGENTPIRRASTGDVVPVDSRTRAPSLPPATQAAVRSRPPSPAPSESATLRMRPQATTPVAPRGAAPPAVARPRNNSTATVETEALIAARLKLLEEGADHFALLGVTSDASPDAVRGAYFTLARKLHPDRLSSLGIADDKRDAQRLFAEINAAFNVLNDPTRRADYQSVLLRGGESAVRAEQVVAEKIATKVMAAEEAFRRGEMALRRDQLAQAVAEFAIAVDAQPNESEYLALYTWAKFAAAADKATIASETRTALLRAATAAEAAAKPTPTARFYLGRVERMLGREREALLHFQEVLAIKPSHSEAASEARILEQRLRAKK